MLGYLLARAGVKVMVLEKHEDFFRDFRGDTIHPSTMEVLAELGILEQFLALPHDEMRFARMNLEGKLYPVADFSTLETRCKFMAFIPQWDFLNFLSAEGKKYPSFDLRMGHEATDVIFDDERIVGVRVQTPAGEMEVRADLVVGTDGRHSIIREKAGLQTESFGVPIDVLWMRIAKPPNPPENTLGYFKNGQFMVLINRKDYYQGGFLIPKGGFEEIKAEGLDAFRKKIVSIAPFLESTVHEIDDWEKVKLLTVMIDRLKQWYRPGLLCIGDAAHAMSPAGGVGINLAIQDAVATANILVAKLRSGTVGDPDLAAVQERREPPTKTIQGLQVRLHQVIINVRPGNARRVILFVNVLRFLPFLRKRIARFIGLGPQPEHVSNDLFEHA
ncbi:MAG: hypothetical protein QOJ65_438 [Fimbriimonadaceae bacterium]|jgi:2-polyprenyl-6-methoxyphenol hydroxylase-like FAD-dependent oxidoreductase|nr:hypothetical protein [Fimbriimonadaceae bacterium]